MDTSHSPQTGLSRLWRLVSKAPARLLIFIIQIYRYSLSSIMGNHCRYAPSCSLYTQEAIKTHGLWVGGWVGLARICRCHPWGASGYDPIPTKRKSAKWYMPWRFGDWKGPRSAEEEM